MQTNLQNSVDRLSQEVAALRAQVSPGFTQGSGPAVAPAAADRATVGKLAGSKRGRDEDESVVGAEEPKKKKNTRGGKKKKAAKEAAKAAAGNAGGEQGKGAGEEAREDAGGDVTMGDDAPLPPLPPLPPQFRTRRPLRIASSSPRPLFQTQALLSPQSPLAGTAQPFPQVSPLSARDDQPSGITFTNEGYITFEGFVFNRLWLINNTRADEGEADQDAWHQRVRDTAQAIMDQGAGTWRELAVEARDYDLDIVHLVWYQSEARAEQEAAAAQDAAAATALPPADDGEL
ncbi:MAG: hypothetical protein Q9195_003724 [Heterodermia aff. obscurata]